MIRRLEDWRFRKKCEERRFKDQVQKKMSLWGFGMTSFLDCLVKPGNDRGGELDSHLRE